MLDLDRRAFVGGAVGLAATSARKGGRAWAEDVRILREAYTAMHPGLYRYATPAQADERLTRLERAFAEARDLPAAFLALSRFTASVRCGHTYPNPYNTKKATIEALFSGPIAPPFLFRWISGRMIVTADLTGEARFRPGDEVVRYGDVRPRALLADLMPLSRADGASDAKRVNNLENRGEDRFEAFDLYAPLVRPGLRGALPFRVRATDGRERTIEAALLTREAKLALTAPPAEADVPWTLQRLDGGVARLIMPGWAFYNSKWDWQAWLNARFDELVETRARGLIIDLRGNEGGLDCGDLIMRRIATKPFQLSGWRRRLRYRKAPVDLAPYLDTWDKSFLDWGDQAVGPEPDGFYRLTLWEDDEVDGVIRPVAKPFTAPTVVLTDASNSSATFQFASNVRRNGLARLVGGTTGGNLRGINGGAFFFLRLPGTGLEVDLPLIGYFASEPQPDAPILPDVAVQDGPLDIAAGRDRALETALETIRRA